MTEASSAAESIYRFFAAFEGFDEAHPLGFEAEVMMPRPRCTSGRLGTDDRAAPLCAAVFSMEPVLTDVRRYIHGGRTLRGACTVSGRVRDDDAKQRQETAAFFSALADYVRQHGTRVVDGDRVFGIRPAAHPARLRLTEDGAAWELRCAVEMTES
jgi:hypothetical protein